MGDRMLEAIRSISRSIRSIWDELWRDIDGLRIAPSTLIAIIFFLTTVVIVLTGFLMLLCCTKRPKRGKGDAQKELLCKKGLFALMLARLDEFDSLTPLIMTPGTPLDPREQTISTSSSLPLHRPSSTSPPPPRRPQAGKTLLVPLNTKYRAPAVPLLGTPESRVTTFEAGTTKSCATIPEDDEETYEDLVSIDRTSFSTRSDVKSQRYFSPSAHNLYVPNTPPEFQVPTPSYEPPLPPSNNQLNGIDSAQNRLQSNNRPQRFQMSNKGPLKASRTESKGEIETNGRSKGNKQGHESPSNSLSSPDSSLGSDSPVDTTGSLSDSFYIDPSKDPDKRTDIDPTGKYQLHRIEEESEHFSEERGMEMIGSKDTQQIARSVSQQFELLQLQQQQRHSRQREFK